MVQPYQTMISIYATKKLRICLKSVEGHWANTEAMAHCHIMSSVAKFYTSEVRLSRRWNGNITASTWWMAVDKPLYIFGGSEIYRLPYIHLLQNNSAPMDRCKNSIQMGYQCKNPFVCCLFIFFYIFVSRSFPLPSAFLSTDIERGKVFGLNTLRRRKIQSETACRPTFQLSRADVLPLQTSKGDGRMTESGNSYIADLW